MENREKEFLEQQKRLAIQLTRALDIKRFKILYVEYWPNLNIDLETGKPVL